DGEEEEDEEEGEEEEEEEGDGFGTGLAHKAKNAAAAAAAAAANGKAAKGSSAAAKGNGKSVSESGDGEEDEDEEEGGSSEGADDDGGDGSGAANVTNGTAAAVAAVDCWSRHVGRELSEAEAAELEGGRSDYRDAPPAEVHSTAWGPNARWQLRLYGNAAAAAGRRNKRGATDGSSAAAANGVVANGNDNGIVGLTELPAAPATLPAYGVKERLITRWREVRQEDAAAAAAGTSGAAVNQPEGDFSTAQQRSLFSLLNAYVDVHLPARPYPTSASDPDPTMDAVLLHALNHVAKTADRIKKNNHALQQQQEQERLRREQEERERQQQQEQRKKQLQQQQGGTKGDTEDPAAAPPPAAAAADVSSGLVGGTPRDQGFTRPKVLMLLPQRNFAFRAVRRLVALALRETRSDSVQGKEKFVEQFTDPDEMQDEESLDPATRARLAAKPADHRALFAGNVDDHFRLGIKVTKGAIRLFADLYQSDIIVASPVALATKLAEDARADPHAAPDFLSSIELLILDRTDVMTMQNWSHVETVVAALNRLPRQQHGTDIMRVRDWYLAGRAGLYRQTVLVGSFASPHVNALARAGGNHGGAVRLAVDQPGVLSRVVPQVRQLFERFAAASAAEAGDARFEFFSRAVWPRIKDSGAKGLLIFVPSYFDFVRLRNALRADDSADLAVISEYSSGSEVTRARARFFHGQRRVLLYTERAHFYNRHRIRGIKDILFYGLPDHGHYYSELVNLLEEGGGAAAAGGAAAGAHQATVTALFCGWDVLQLERVVGSGRARRMLRGESGTYMFC
ncbi:hypothetical protein Agub_g2307, partial [Astrephomene gubernaculifera]